MTLGKPEEQRSPDSLTALPQGARKAEMRGVARILGGLLAKPELGLHSTTSWLKSSPQRLPRAPKTATLGMSPGESPCATTKPSIYWSRRAGAGVFQQRGGKMGSAYINPVGGGLEERLPGSLPHLLGLGCPVRSPYTPEHYVGNWGVSGPRL